MAEPKSTESKTQATTPAAGEVLSASVTLQRRVNDTNGDNRQWIVVFAATDGEAADWAPADRAPVFPLQLTVSGDVGDALEIGKTYRVTITEA
jgi:hypothetical protein